MATNPSIPNSEAQISEKTIYKEVTEAMYAPDQSSRIPLCVYHIQPEINGVKRKLKSVSFTLALILDQSTLYCDSKKDDDGWFPFSEKTAEDLTSFNPSTQHEHLKVLLSCNLIWTRRASRPGAAREIKVNYQELGRLMEECSEDNKHTPSLLS